MNKTLVALLATTLLSTSTVTLAIADAHGPQKTIGQTKALIAEAGLSSVSNASSLSKNLKDGESGNTNFPSRISRPSQQSERLMQSRVWL